VHCEQLTDKTHGMGCKTEQSYKCRKWSLQPVLVAIHLHPTFHRWAAITVKDNNHGNRQAIEPRKPIK
jgi:hypothetical protein